MVAGRAAAGGDDGSRPAAVCVGSVQAAFGLSGGVHWAAQAVTSRLRRRFSGVGDVVVHASPGTGAGRGRRRRFGRQYLRRWRRVVAAARTAAARVAVAGGGGESGDVRLGRLICVGQTPPAPTSVTFKTFDASAGCAASAKSISRPYYVERVGVLHLLVHKVHRLPTDQVMCIVGQNRYTLLGVGLGRCA